MIDAVVGAKPYPVMDSMSAHQLAGNPELEPLACGARGRLRRV